MTSKEMEEALLKLPTAEKERMLELLAGDLHRQSIASGIDAEWIAEIDRRIQSIEDGSAKLIPLEEVLRKLRRNSA